MYGRVDGLPMLEGLAVDAPELCLNGSYREGVTLEKLGLFPLATSDWAPSCCVGLLEAPGIRHLSYLPKSGSYSAFEDVGPVLLEADDVTGVSELS